MMQTIAKPLDSNVRAISLIGVYAFYTGCFMLLGIATPILRLKVYNFDGESILGAVAIALLGWLLSKNLSKSLTSSCFHNLEIKYSAQLLMAIALLWLSLLLILSLDLSEILTDGLISGLWAIVAVTLIGVALRMGRANQVANYKNPDKNLNKNPNKSLKPSVNPISITYNHDQGNAEQIIISPDALTQQPQQFKALMCLALSLFSWTILDLPEGIAELTAIALAGWGLTGLTTSQVILCPAKRTVTMQFSGIWGMASSYRINLVQFSRLEIIKLKEIDMQWLQLAGSSSVITLPNSVVECMNKNEPNHPAPNLSQTLMDRLNLAEHKVSRDMLSAMNILLPQSVSTLAGVLILGLGVAFAVLLPLPPKMLLETSILLIGICLLSPSLGRLIIRLVAPSSMPNEQSAIVLPAWQVGVGLIITAVVSGSKFNSQTNSQIESLLTLTLIWLCCGVGGCILALSRRSPLITRRF
jgi:hypothetical protein